MKFAFVIHPLSEQTRLLMRLNGMGDLPRWGGDMGSFFSSWHDRVKEAQDQLEEEPKAVRMVHELRGICGAGGAHAEGRLYEIPMDAAEILDNPGDAVVFIEEAIRQAADWGARIVGLGSLTGVVGSQGRYCAGRAPVAVTTGNSLTVYAAVKNLLRACQETHIDLREQTVAIVGVPGSIATAAAALLAPHCGRMLLAARRLAPRAVEICPQPRRKAVRRCGRRRAAIDGDFLGHLQRQLHRSALAAARFAGDRCGRPHGRLR